MATTLFERVKTDLGPGELDRRLLEHRPGFQEVHGLIRKSTDAMSLAVMSVDLFLRGPAGAGELSRDRAGKNDYHSL